MCKTEKELSEFHFSANHGGHTPRCKPCGIEYAKQWYAANKDRKRAYDEKRRAQKRELYRDASKRFRAAHPERVRAETEKRRAQMKLATPEWADKFLLREAYSLVKLRGAATGIKWHVDHIIPLRSDLVCGLHVPWNLQLVPAMTNILKSNHFSIEHGGVK